MAQKNKSIVKQCPIQWEKPFFYHKEEKFFPKVYLPKGDENVPDVFPDAYNAVMIHLDGTFNADLNWEVPLRLASKHIAAGKWILWKLELGLFDRLHFPLNNEMQYHSLCLSVEQFLKYAWAPFSEHTMGLVLYQGSLDFSSIAFSETLEENFREWLSVHAKTTENSMNAQIIRGDAYTQHLFHLFSRDVALDYLHSLIGQLPQSLEPFILLDAKNIELPAQLAELLDEERFEQMHLAVKNSLLPLQGLAWADHLYYAGDGLAQELRVGVCLPTNGLDKLALEALNRVLLSLNQNKIPYRIMTEKNISAEWDGLETIYALKSSLSESGRRMLNGFAAASGEIISI